MWKIQGSVNVPIFIRCLNTKGQPTMIDINKIVYVEQNERFKDTVDVRLRGEGGITLHLDIPFERFWQLASGDETKV